MTRRPIACALVPLALLAQIETAHAQQRPAPQPPPAVAAPAPAPMEPLSTAEAEQIREQLRTVLRQYPPSVVEVLRRDPSLLASEQYLATYPALARFLAQHPEIVRNPAYFFGEAGGGGWQDESPRAEAIRMWRSVIDGLQVFAVIATITGAFVWLIKMLLDYRKWLRLTRVQTEVHTKLLDRFATNDDLLAYIQTPAGRRFLESTPIPIDAEPPKAIGAPYNRILWSVQAGIVMVLGGLALQFVGARATFEEIGEPLFSIGIVVLAIGLGFVLSAIASYLLSRRLGLLPQAVGGVGTGAPGGSL